jgi:hypothetical protein
MHTRHTDHNRRLPGSIAAMTVGWERPARPQAAPATQPQTAPRPSFQPSHGLRGWARA